MENTCISAWRDYSKKIADFHSTKLGCHESRKKGTLVSKRPAL